MERESFRETVNVDQGYHDCRNSSRGPPGRNVLVREMELVWPSMPADVEGGLVAERMSRSLLASLVTRLLSLVDSVQKAQGMAPLIRDSPAEVQVTERGACRRGLASASGNLAEDAQTHDGIVLVQERLGDTFAEDLAKQRDAWHQAQG